MKPNMVSVTNTIVLPLCLALFSSACDPDNGKEDAGSSSSGGGTSSSFMTSSSGVPGSSSSDVSSSSAKPDAGPQFLLQLVAQPTEGGQVSADPPSEDGNYAPGTTVTVTAAPAFGYGFKGWSGDSTAVELVIPVVMDGPRTLTAVFAQKNTTDTTPPKVQVLPRNNATCVELNRSIVLQFDEEMNRAATKAAFSVTPAVEGTLVWSEDGRTLTLTPAAAFPESSTYTLNLTRSAKDFAGNAIKAVVTTRFTTRGGEEVPGSLRCLAGWLSGFLHNDAQYWELLTGPSSNWVKRIRLRIKRTWPENADGYWFYLEQAITYGDTPQSEQPPYRQRLYHLTQIEPGKYVNKIYKYNGDQTTLVGTWQEADPLAGKTLEEFTELAGCAVNLSWNGTDQYTGGTTGKNCVVQFEGSAYMTSEATVHEGGAVFWDRGFDASDQQVWGGNERYAFDKIENFPLVP